MLFVYISRVSIRKVFTFLGITAYKYMIDHTDRGVKVFKMSKSLMLHQYFCGGSIIVS